MEAVQAWESERASAPGLMRECGSSLQAGARGVLAGAVLSIGEITGGPGPVTLGRLPGLSVFQLLPL